MEGGRTRRRSVSAKKTIGRRAISNDFLVDMKLISAAVLAVLMAAVTSQAMELCSQTFCSCPEAGKRVECTCEAAAKQVIL